MFRAFFTGTIDWLRGFLLAGKIRKDNEIRSRENEARDHRQNERMAKIEGKIEALELILSRGVKDG